MTSTDMRIGEKIKRLRLASDLTQAELADRAELTKGFISQLENEQSSISVDSLADILDALGVSLAEFFTDAPESQIKFGSDDRVQIERRGISRFEMLVPGSTNNIMDPIYLELGPGEKLEKQGPLPGEQFGYVLKGKVTLTVNKKKFQIKTDQCFYFSSDREHQLSNDHDQTAKLLWVTSPPLM